jgi:hypothetical protein
VIVLDKLDKKLTTIETPELGTSGVGGKDT